MTTPIITNDPDVEVTFQDANIVEVTPQGEPIVDVTILAEPVVQISTAGFQGPRGYTVEVYPFSYRGALQVEPGAFPIPLSHTYQLDSVDIAVLSPPLGSPVIIDVELDGVSVFVIRPQILPGDTHALPVALPTTPLGPGDLTVDIDSVGSAYPGMNLSVVVRLIKL